MAEARRTVCLWLLTALLERGPQHLVRALPESRRIERPLSAHEARRLLMRGRQLPILG